MMDFSFCFFMELNDDFVSYVSDRRTASQSPSNGKEEKAVKHCRKGNEAHACSFVNCFTRNIDVTFCHSDFMNFNFAFNI